MVLGCWSEGGSLADKWNALFYSRLDDTCRCLWQGNRANYARSATQHLWNHLLVVVTRWNAGKPLIIRRQRLVRAPVNMSCSSVRCSSNGRIMFLEEGSHSNKNIDWITRLAIARAFTLSWEEQITCFISVTASSLHTNEVKMPL